MKKSLTTRIYIMYGIALLPLLIFGFYKNGISLYAKDYIDFYPMFRSIIIMVLALGGALTGSAFREYLKDKKVSDKSLKRCKTDIVEALLVSCILPINTNMLVAFIVPLLSSLLLNRVKFNRIALMYLAIEGANVLLKVNSFKNVYEASTVLNYDGFDLFLGMGPGGMFSTSVLFILLGTIFLSFNKLYKRELVFSSIGTFLILGIIPSMMRGAYTGIFPYIFGYNVLFVLAFIAPNIESSCYTEKGQITSGILIGILTYAISFISPYTAAVGAVFIVSLLSGILDRIFVIK